MSTVAATHLDAPVRRTLGYQPALDGIRGVAVAGVVAFHLGHLQGGFLGVDLFFTLSGYLITRLLLLEYESTGRISRADFWTRRAWRLLPALYLLLASIAVYAALFARPDELEGIRGPGIASLLYVTNWFFIFNGDGYWDIFSAPSPLEHMWSLAIEEQFYVVWPLVVVAVIGVGARATRRGRRSSEPAEHPEPDARRPVARLLALTVGLALGSTVYLGLLAGDDISRAYFGSIARSSSILIGAALAMVVHRGDRWLTTATAARAAPAAGALAVAYLAWSWIAIDGATDLFFYRGGFLLHAIAVAVLIALMTARPDGVGARVLGAAPLRGLGVVSYGLYLWHWPVIVVVDAERTGLTGGSLLVTRLVVSLALTVASYLAVESPARHRLSKRMSAVRVFVPAAVLVAIALVVSTVPVAGETVIGPPPSGAGAATVSDTPTATTPDPGAPEPTDGATALGGVGSDPAATSDQAESPVDDVVGDEPATEVEDTAAVGDVQPVGIVRTTPSALPMLRSPSSDDPLSVLLVGDSYMFDAEPGIVAALAASGVVAPIASSRLGFTITADGWEQTLLAVVADHEPELVVAMWARFDAAWLEAGGDEAEYERRLDQAIEILTSDGAVVAFVGLAPSLTAGVDREPVDRGINDLFEAIPGRHPGVAIYVDPDPIVAPDGEPDRWLETAEGSLLVRKVDVSHYCGDGSARFGLAVGELVQQLTGVPAADPASWWAGEWRDDPRYDDPAGACT